MEAGEPVIKYGARIGYAKEAIRKGARVHVHNLRTALGEVLEYQYEPGLQDLWRCRSAVFQGYIRERTGRPYIRNEIWILPTVGCVNSVAARAIETRAGRNMHWERAWRTSSLFSIPLAVPRWGRSGKYAESVCGYDPSSQCRLMCYLRGWAVKTATYLF